MHPAVCTGIIDTGTRWNEKKQKLERKLVIQFVTDKLMPADDEGKQRPYLVQHWSNFSMYGNSYLRRDICSWIGKRLPDDEAESFDFASLVGKTAMLNISLSDDGKWSNVQSVNPLPEGMNAPVVTDAPILIDLSAPDEAMINRLSDKMQARIRSSNEYRDAGGEKPAQAVSGHTTEDIPLGAYDDPNDPIPF